MVSVVFKENYTSSETDGDWDTGIDYVLYQSSSDHYHVEIEEIPVLLTIQKTTVTRKYYCENYETGGYGPDMEIEGVEERKPECFANLYNFEWPEHIYTFDSFSQEWMSLIKEITQMKKGENKDIDLSPKFYRFISTARLEVNLNSIFERHDRGYEIETMSRDRGLPLHIAYSK